MAIKKGYQITLRAIVLSLGIFMAAVSAVQAEDFGSSGLNFEPAQDAIAPTDANQTSEYGVSSASVVGSPLSMPPTAGELPPKRRGKRSHITRQVPPPPEDRSTVLNAGYPSESGQMDTPSIVPSREPGLAIPQPLPTAVALSPDRSDRTDVKENNPRSFPGLFQAPGLGNDLPTVATQSQDLSYGTQAAPSSGDRESSRSLAIPASLEPSLHKYWRELTPLFEGSTNSLVARAVGSAEGTRTASGGKTSAFRGHVDPGNGVWNLGTFSYQHGARSPQEADRKQLARLRRQASIILRGAERRGLTMSLADVLNAIDLANQSPRAALNRNGFMDRLKQARDRGMRGSEAILWARTFSFRDSERGRWTAPGLGNTYRSITRDQHRRMRAIDRAIAYSAQPWQYIPTTAQAENNSSPNLEVASGQVSVDPAERNAAAILSLDVSDPSLQF